MAGAENYGLADLPSLVWPEWGQRAMTLWVVDGWVVALGSRGKKDDRGEGRGAREGDRLDLEREGKRRAIFRPRDQ